MKHAHVISTPFLWGLDLDQGIQAWDRYQVADKYTTYAQCLIWAGAHRSCVPAPHIFFYCLSSCTSYRILAQKYCGVPAPKYKQYRHTK